MSSDYPEYIFAFCDEDPEGGDTGWIYPNDASAFNLEGTQKYYRGDVFEALRNEVLEEIATYIDEMRISSRSQAVNSIRGKKTKENENE